MLSPTKVLSPMFTYFWRSLVVQAIWLTAHHDYNAHHPCKVWVRNERPEPFGKPPEASRDAGRGS